MELWNLEVLGFNTTTPYMASNQGWTSVETVLVQLNSSFTPSGRFPVYSNSEEKTGIGFDAAVCVQRYEPWVIEAYNASTGSPSALRVVGKGDDSNPLLPSGNIQGTRAVNTRYLNKTGKDGVFFSAHGNSLNRMLEVKLTQDEDWFGDVPPPVVGPVVPLHSTTSLLTSTYFTGRVFWWRDWTSGICRTLPRTGCYCPRTGWCAQRSTILCGVGARCRTIV